MYINMIAIILPLSRTGRMERGCRKGIDELMELIEYIS